MDIDYFLLLELTCGAILLGNFLIIVLCSFTKDEPITKECDYCGEVPPSCRYCK